MWTIYILAGIILFVAGVCIGEVINANRKPVAIVDPLVDRISKLSPKSYRYVSAIVQAREAKDENEKHNLYFKQVDGE